MISAAVNLAPAPASGEQPFLKWPGGKRSLVSQLLALVPRSYERYFEPFLGSAALFFALNPTEAYLSDKNKELINCYTQVQQSPESVIAVLRKLPNTRHDYYRIRNQALRSGPARAAQFIYLLNLSFNGIYRVNSRGRFNVPYGYRSNRLPCESHKIRAASELLSAAKLSDGDFERAVSDAGEHDFVYLDPPYAAADDAKESQGFVRYNPSLFSWDDQLRLARLAHSLARRGCHVMVSNALDASIRRLYPTFQAHTVQRLSAIAAKSSARKRVREYVLLHVK